MVDSLNQVARRCKELGIMCVLENKLPHLLFGNTSDILWILDGINTAEIGACLAGNLGYRSIYWTLDSQDGVEPVKTPQFLTDRITSKSDAISMVQSFYSTWAFAARQTRCRP